MNRCLLGLLLLAVAVAAEDKPLVFPKLKVTIYYEALCQDSISFIRNQFMKAYNLIGAYLKVVLIPYGKTRHWYQEGDFAFSCHHGEKECHANEVQACALHARHNNQTASVKFVYCAMGLRDPSSDYYLRRCANDCGMPWKPIKSCANSKLGGSIMAKLGDKTHALSPKLKVLPTIVFNDNYCSKIQTKALHDFLATACDNLTPRPKVCPEKRDVYWYK